MPRHDHFVHRCLQRNVYHNPIILYEEIVRAIEDGRDDFVEKVCVTHARRIVYRFRVPNGIFYALTTKSGNPITVLKRGSAVKVKRRGKMILKKLN